MRAAKAAAGRGGGLTLVSLLMFSAPAAQAAAPCSPDTLDLRWPGGETTFAVELAVTPEERARGLMGREEMAPEAGMLFIYEAPQQVRFWMEGTPLPLDMIFADDSGRVTRVHGNAAPFDRTTIDGGENVRFVLEVNAGVAAHLGIGEGAEMHHPAIGADAAWPCE